jgi:hypothetical protein
VRKTPVLILADHWYTNGTVIGVTGVAVGVVAIIVAVLLWRFGTPRGLLEYSMPVSEALMGRSPHLKPDDIQLTVRGKPAKDPYLVTIRIVNNGHRDIRSDDFDDNKPLSINLGAEVLSILTSPDQGHPSFSFETGREVLVMPTLIRRGQSITASLLTEGAPSLSCSNPLADVKVRLQPGSSGEPIWLANIGMACPWLFIVALIMYKFTSQHSVLNFIARILAIFSAVVYAWVWAMRLRYMNSRRIARKNI